MPLNSSVTTVSCTLILVVTLLTILPGCYYDVEEELNTPDACVTTGMSYQADIKPIIDSQCNACHNGASRLGGISLETHADVSQYASNGRLIGVIRHDSGYSPMPKNGAKLPDCAIAKIEAWIADGFPDN